MSKENPKKMNKPDPGLGQENLRIAIENLADRKLSQNDPKRKHWGRGFKNEGPKDLEKQMMSEQVDKKTGHPDPPDWGRNE